LSGVSSTRTERKETVGSGWPKAPGPSGSNGNGKRKWFGDRRRFPKGTYKIATWILLAAVVMMFVALASAYVFLSGGEQWKPVRMPRTFLLSTALILASSVTIEKARQQLAIDIRQHARWMFATLFLGIAFVVSQLVAWRKLVAAGVYLSGNPHNSFFYLFTGAHGLHLFGGMLALTYLVVRSRRLLIGIENEKRIAATDAVSLYWHFMDGLWVALFLLLWFWN
jgi:cytochrome c oxidase subunit 3